MFTVVGFAECHCYDCYDSLTVLIYFLTRKLGRAHSFASLKLSFSRERPPVRNTLMCVVKFVFTRWCCFVSIGCGFELDWGFVAKSCDFWKAKEFELKF